MQQYKHNNKQHLCFHCNELKEGGIELFNISDRGYMSSFEGMSFNIQLCKECVEDLDIEEHWFDNSICYNSISGEYENECYIVSLIDTFIIDNQEYIYNCDDTYQMTREEWLEFNS